MLQMTQSIASEAGWCDMDEHTSLVALGGIGAFGVVALAVCGHSAESVGLLMFMSALALYIIGKKPEAKA